MVGHISRQADWEIDKHTGRYVRMYVTQIPSSHNSLGVDELSIASAVLSNTISRSTLGKSLFSVSREIEIYGSWVPWVRNLE